MKAPVLILGCTGLLGQALMKEGRARGLPLLGAARTGGDFTGDLADAEHLAAVLDAAAPGIVINAAALVDLGLAERDPAAAWRINARLPALLAEQSRARGFRLVQVSTDHYYTGDGAALHDEDAPILLLNEYARSKHAGECLALSAPGALILRTNIVGFRGQRDRPTFMEWLAAGLAAGEPLTLFRDYFTSSIDVASFAAALFDLLPKSPVGVLNLASSEVSSKEAFARAFAAEAGFSDQACRSGAVRGLAGPRRAESLGLDVARAERLLGYRLPGLAQVIGNLVKQHEEWRNAL